MTLKEFMEEYNYSTEDISSLTGIDKRTITSYMQRKKEPRACNCLKLMLVSDGEITIGGLCKTVVVIDEEITTFTNPAKKVEQFIKAQRKVFDKMRKYKMEIGL